MPKPQKPSPVPQVPTPVPQRSDRANFAARGDAMMTALPGLVNGVNTAVDYIDAAADFVSAEADRAQTQANAASGSAGQALGFAALSSQEADRAAASADQAAQASLSVANFKGSWSSLVGALNMPAAVVHDGMIWLLLQNLSDVTAAEPGVSPVWMPALADAVQQSVWLASGTDLNNVVTSGFYRLRNTHPNWPSNVVEHGQMIVSRGGETILQIVTGWNSGRMWFRQAAGIGATPSWGSWRRLAEHSETPIDASGGVMDCLTGNYFTAMISANTTLSFANIPAGAYSCVLEAHHTAGTMTFPSGTVWSGAAPTLSPGRHLFFFQRAQIGTVGWYASALPGYSA